MDKSGLYPYQFLMNGSAWSEVGTWRTMSSPLSGEGSQLALPS